MASLPDTLIGHDELLAQMARDLAAGRLHHGWLLNGPEGIGKFKAALHLAAWLLSVRMNHSQPVADELRTGCLIPDSDPDHPDVRLALTQTHPDLLIVKPSEDEKNKSTRSK